MIQIVFFDNFEALIKYNNQQKFKKDDEILQ